MVVPAVPATRLATILPWWKDSGIRLVSATETEKVPITSVGRTSIANYNQLHNIVMRAMDAGKKVTVGTGASGPQSGVGVEPSRLVALSQAASPDEGPLLVTEDGNPWVLVRRDGIRCKVMTRVERERRLLQVAVSLGVCWGPQVTLPAEVKASCNGEPLRCLSTAGTLDKLYGNGKSNDSENTASDILFSLASERPDYLIPTNYKKLQEAQPADANRHGPALATVPGLQYPGPAMLGDARALASILLRRQLYQPGEPERVGWVMFTGDALAAGKRIELDVDLGGGPVRLTFEVPAN